MDTLTVLIEARNLIEKPGSWTQNAAARSADGGSCCHLSKEAVSFCAVGALARVTADNSFYEAVCCLQHDLVGKSIVDFNNSRTHAEVLSLFDKAIATERAKFEAQFLDPQQTLSDCTEPSSPRIEAELVP